MVYAVSKASYYLIDAIFAKVKTEIFILYPDTFTLCTLICHSTKLVKKDSPILFYVIIDFLSTFVKTKNMQALVSIIMGSTSDLPVMEPAAKFLNDMQIPFEINALSAHRTPEKVEEFARAAYGRGIRVIIAAAGMAAHLPGVIAAMTSVPVIGVPVKATLEGIDSLLSIVQMPPGIPVATVGINAAQNSAILTVEILAVSDPVLYQKLLKFKEDLKKKIVKANEDLALVQYDFKIG